MTHIKQVHVIGAGLAGSEAAWGLAQAGVPVRLHEMRPLTMTPAHKTNGCAELVCSNSFRSDDAAANAVGLLHAELRKAGSIVMAAADSHQVPAGSALAVDRDGFSAAVTAALESHPLIEIARGEIADVADLLAAGADSVIVATGPLTAPSLAQSIRALTGEDDRAATDCRSVPHRQIPRRPNVRARIHRDPRADLSAESSQDQAPPAVQRRGRRPEQENAHNAPDRARKFVAG